MTEQHWQVFCLRLPGSCPAPGRGALALRPWPGEAVLAEVVVYVGARDFPGPAPACGLLATGSSGSFWFLRSPGAAGSRGCCSGGRISVASAAEDGSGPG